MVLGWAHGFVWVYFLYKLGVLRFMFVVYVFEPKNRVGPTLGDEPHLAANTQDVRAFMYQACLWVFNTFSAGKKPQVTEDITAAQAGTPGLLSKLRMHVPVNFEEKLSPQGHQPKQRSSEAETNAI